MRFRINPSLVIAFGLAAAAGGWIYSGQLGSPPGEDATATPERPEQQASNINTVQPEPMAVRVRESVAALHRPVFLVTGRTEAERRAVLRAETDGRIVDIMAEESTALEKGAPILKIALSDRMARLRQAESLIKQREIEFEAAKSLAGKGFQTKSSRAQAEANLSAARAQREQIRVDLARTTISAPFAGILESRAVEIGDYVKAGDMIGRLADFDPALVTVQISEREIDQIEEGIMAEVALINGERLPGLVSRIATTAETATRTFQVEIEVPNSDGRIRDGITAKVLLPAQEILAHKISPSLLGLNDAGQVGVKTVDADNRVVFYPIRIIEDLPDGMWVSGLPDQATIITVGHAYVVAGAEVKPRKEGANEPDGTGMTSTTTAETQPTGGRS